MQDSNKVVNYQQNLVILYRRRINVRYRSTRLVWRTETVHTRIHDEIIRRAHLFVQTKLNALRSLSVSDNTITRRNNDKTA